VPAIRIFCEDFGGSFVVKGERGAVRLIDLLKGLHLAILAELDEDEWRHLKEDDRILIHEARCERLKAGPPHFELDQTIRRVDALFGKTIFHGLKRIGPPENLEWELRLAAPKEKKEKLKAWWGPCMYLQFLKAFSRLTYYIPGFFV